MNPIFDTDFASRVRWHRFPDFYMVMEQRFFECCNRLFCRSLSLSLSLLSRSCLALDPVELVSERLRSEPISAFRTDQNQSEPIRSNQSQWKRTKTNKNQPKPIKTNQNESNQFKTFRTKQYQSEPIRSSPTNQSQLKQFRTNQNQLKPIRTH